MRLVWSAVVLIGLLGSAKAEVGFPSNDKIRLADAAADACYANCASDNASCKRACPTTFNVPCLTACDNQSQSCRQSCQRR
jgi:hypothetical protein